MEIKTTRDIVFKHIKEYFPDDKRWDTKKWIAQDEIIKELDKTWNMINKHKMDRHPNYISKTQVAKFLGNLKNTITSDSRSSDEDSLNKGYTKWERDNMVIVAVIPDNRAEYPYESVL